MVRINNLTKDVKATVYAKVETFNPGNSIKDRMALYILEQSYKNETIKPGNVIVEATSGNTGIAFAAIGKALGHPVKIIMPNWLSKERMDIIQSLGAEIILITKEEGGFLGSIALSEKMKREDELLLSFVDEPLLLPLLLPPMLPVMTDVSAARQFRSRLNGTYNFLHEPSSASISFIFSIFQMYTNIIFII